jgi:hypothetical protein
MRSQSATHASALSARLFVVSPEHMRCANKPVIVQGAQLDAFSIGEHAWSTEQRNVVKMDNVKVLIKQLFQLVRFANRLSQLMRRNQINISSGTTIQHVHGDTRIRRVMPFTRVRDERFASEREGVFVMDNMHVVTAPSQRIRQSLHENTVAAKIVWRKKCGHHSDFQFRQDLLAT